MRYLLLITSLFIFAISVDGYANDSSSKGKKEVVYKTNTEIDFGDREVDGEFMNPDGRSVRGEKNLYFDSLMDERKSFGKELQRSSGAVR